jgi:hypothetical protein
LLASKLAGPSGASQGQFVTVGSKLPAKRVALTCEVGQRIIKRGKGVNGRNKMATINFDEATEIALRTWYPKDHPLHFNPHHPLGKLLGEWGELLDDYADSNKTDDKYYLTKLLAKWGKLMDNYMKSLYKPGYVFEPEDELGDIWYYERILAYQEGCKLEDSVSFEGDSTDQVIAQVMWRLAERFIGLSLEPAQNGLNETYSAIIQIGERYNLTLDDLTQSNWEKLEPGSERGEEWMKARVDTDYTRGKIGLK